MRRIQITNSTIKKYGLKREQFVKIWLAQGERCAACRNRGRMTIDYSEAEEVHIICVVCKHILRSSSRDTDRLRAVTEYLDVQQTKSPNPVPTTT